MANLSTVPQTNVILTLTKSQVTTAVSSFEIKLVPHNPDGTIFNCTGIVTVTMNVPTYVGGQIEAIQQQAMTTGTADATGIIVSLSEAQANNLINLLPNPSTPFSITGTDGVPNTSLLGTGTVNAKFSQ